MFECDRLEARRKSPRIKRLRAAFTYGSLRALLWFRPSVSAKRNRLKWETGNARDASAYSTVGRYALRGASVSRDCETTHFPRDRSDYYARGGRQCSRYLSTGDLRGWQWTLIASSSVSHRWTARITNASPPSAWVVLVFDVYRLGMANSEWKSIPSTLSKHSVNFWRTTLQKYF